MACSVGCGRGLGQRRCVREHCEYACGHEPRGRAEEAIQRVDTRVIRETPCCDRLLVQRERGGALDVAAQTVRNDFNETDL